jgi:quercetin dioxygenase-like cupin family protein
MKIIHADQLPEIGTSHAEEIKKKVFLEKGLVPRLMMFSSAVLKPGQMIEIHAHPTMFEIFYVLSGQLEFTVNGEKSILKAGDCLVAEPGEQHSQNNPYNIETRWVYYGIAIND